MVRFPFSAAEWTLIAVKGPGSSPSSLPPLQLLSHPFFQKGFQGIHKEPLGGLEAFGFPALGAKAGMGREGEDLDPLWVGAAPPEPRDFLS